MIITILPGNNFFQKETCFEHILDMRGDFGKLCKNIMQIFTNAKKYSSIKSGYVYLKMNKGLTQKYSMNTKTL